MKHVSELLKSWLSPQRRWPTAIVVFMTVFIAVNLAFVTTALRHRPQLVSETYYPDGFNLRQIAERRAAAEALGWKFSVEPVAFDRADMPLVRIEVREADGGPCDSLHGTVSFYRPSEKLLDVAAVPIHPMGPGKYFATLPRSLEHGAWQAVIHVARGRQQVDQRVDFFVD